VTEEVRGILKEFSGNRAAMAAEIARLRARLDDASYEISRLASSRGATTVLYPSASPPIRPAHPVGF
jgi:hypothetical protein